MRISHLLWFGYPVFSVSENWRSRLHAYVYWIWNVERREGKRGWEEARGCSVVLPEHMIRSSKPGRGSVATWWLYLRPAEILRWAIYRCHNLEHSIRRNGIKDLLGKSLTWGWSKSVSQNGALRIRNQARSHRRGNYNIKDKEEACVSGSR